MRTNGTSGGKGKKGRQAAYFDLDKTVLATSTTLAMDDPMRRSGLISTMALTNLNNGPVIPQDEYLVLGAPRLSEEMARRVCAQVGLAVKNVIEIRIRHQITLVAIVGTSQ